LDQLPDQLSDQLLGLTAELAGEPAVALGQQQFQDEKQQEEQQQQQVWQVQKLALAQLSDVSLNGAVDWRTRTPRVAEIGVALVICPAVAQAAQEHPSLRQDTGLLACNHQKKSVFAHRKVMMEPVRCNGCMSSRKSQIPRERLTCAHVLWLDIPVAARSMKYIAHHADIQHTHGDMFTQTCSTKIENYTWGKEDA